MIEINDQQALHEISGGGGGVGLKLTLARASVTLRTLNDQKGPVFPGVNVFNLQRGLRDGRVPVRGQGRWPDCPPTLGGVAIKPAADLG